MRWFNKPKTNNISQVKRRLITTFAKIALSTSFIVFFAFSFRLVIAEDTQIELHLKSFERIAIKHYELVQDPVAQMSTSVTAYFNPEYLPEVLQADLPYSEGQVTRYRKYSDQGILIYYVNFEFKGHTVPLYLTIGVRSIDFGDDNWDALMAISMLLVLFLVLILNFSVKRMFDGLMRPVTELSEQLNSGVNQTFSVSKYSIDELKQLTNELNQYKQMRERVSKQEMMFAKYASHELKTPIAIVLGAANLQAMKDDPEFQTKQRERILIAAENMQATVEILLNIVKQENANVVTEMWRVDENQLKTLEYIKNLNPEVHFELSVSESAQVNFPVAVLNMILKNLVSNAIRFTENGYIKISIRSDEISVEDSGSGLMQTNETEHGLGLLIVRRLCRAYGWEFELKDNSDQGCTARLFLDKYVHDKHSLGHEMA